MLSRGNYFSRRVGTSLHHSLQFYLAVFKWGWQGHVFLMPRVITSMRQLLRGRPSFKTRTAWIWTQDLWIQNLPLSTIEPLQLFKDIQTLYFVPTIPKLYSFYNNGAILTCFSNRSVCYMLENLNGAFHILDQYIKHPRGWFVQAGMSNLQWSLN